VSQTIPLRQGLVRVEVEEESVALSVERRAKLAP